MDQKPAFPWVLLALDVMGTVLLVVGILSLTGINFGHPVLTKVAPGFIVLGVLLFVPFIVWIVRQAQRQGAAHS